MFSLCSAKRLGVLCGSIFGTKEDKEKWMSNPIKLLVTFL